MRDLLLLFEEPSRWYARRRRRGVSLDDAIEEAKLCFRTFMPLQRVVEKMGEGTREVDVFEKIMSNIFSEQIRAGATSFYANSTRQREKSIDDALIWLSLSQPARNNEGFDHCCLSDFDGADLMTSRISAVTEDRTFFADAKPDDLDGRLNVSIIVGSDSPYEEKTAFQAMRCRLVSPRRAAPHLGGYYPHAVEMLRAWVRTDGTYQSTPLFVGSLNRGKTWGVRGASAAMVTELTQTVGYMLGVQFTRRYEWAVYLGWAGHPTIRFVTTPHGAREVFRLRDLPNGASRRAALRHWVSEHWRKRRAEPEEAMKVRAHLRGATDFAWNGLVCKIRPSAFDEERVLDAEAAKKASSK